MNHEPNSLPVILWSTNGEYTISSTAGLRGRGLTDFRGWWCTAGKNTLFIEADGNILRGSCQMGGVFGNIFGPLRYPKTGVYCEVQGCKSSEDLRSPKFRVKDLETDYNFKKTTGIEGEIAEPSLITGAERPPEGRFLKRVIWNLDERISEKPELFMKAVQHIDRFFSHGDKTEFLFHCDEPEQLPMLVEAIQFLKERGHLWAVLKNGVPQLDFKIACAEEKSPAASQSAVVSAKELLETNAVDAINSSRFRERVARFLEPIPSLRSLFFKIEYKVLNWKSELHSVFISVIHANPTVKRSYYSFRHFLIRRLRSQNL